MSWLVDTHLTRGTPTSACFRTATLCSQRNAFSSRQISFLWSDSAGILNDRLGGFTSPEDIGNVIVGNSGFGLAVYLRDLVDIRSGYQSPARYLNYYSWRDGPNKWQRTRAITLSVRMRSGEQIAKFAENVQGKLVEAQRLFSADLTVASTSDQPRQNRSC